ncbi:hypothetical protein BYT27DRAFT_7287606 [Phlegmacium glaucopus]|nr:hypothetical protein BYT27DRAFT_7287606 [Phlegmacium glaucopus]
MSPTSVGFQVASPYWLTFNDFCPVIVAGFFFGLYTGCFFLYLYLHAMKTLKASDTKRNYRIYLLCMLYGLSAVKFGLDVLNILVDSGLQQFFLGLCLQGNIQVITSGFYYFLSKSILIYRCWIVWGRRTSVTIIPFLLALAGLGSTLAQILTIRMERNYCFIYTFYDVDIINQGLYLAADGLVMGLIVLKIVMVYLEVRPIVAHSGRENKFRPLIFILFILIESGSVIFVTQLCSIIVWCLLGTNSVSAGTVVAYSFLETILTQVPLNGIIPTIILVREALGMSYNDITPLSQTIESLAFADNDDTSGNSNQEVEQLDAQASDSQDIVEVNRSSTS